MAAHNPPTLVANDRMIVDVTPQARAIVEKLKTTRKGREAAKRFSWPKTTIFRTVARFRSLWRSGDCDAMRLRQFAAEHGGALVDGWKLFEAASLFSEAPE